mgnify:CR=1 FL=1
MRIRRARSGSLLTLPLHMAHREPIYLLNLFTRVYWMNPLVHPKKPNLRLASVEPWYQRECKVTHGRARGWNYNFIKWLVIFTNKISFDPFNFANLLFGSEWNRCWFIYKRGWLWGSCAWSLGGDLWQFQEGQRRAILLCDFSPVPFLCSVLPSFLLPSFKQNTSSLRRRVIRVYTRAPVAVLYEYNRSVWQDPLQALRFVNT